jgi:hypothetical protein
LSCTGYKKPVRKSKECPWPAGSDARSLYSEALGQLEAIEEREEEDDGEGPPEVARSAHVRSQTDFRKTRPPFPTAAAGGGLFAGASSPLQE